MILPPFIDYKAGKPSSFPWFSQYFRADGFERRLGAIDARDFLAHFRARWDAAGMVGFCISKAGDPARARAASAGSDCMSRVAPHGMFWRALNVSFTEYREVYSLDVAHLKSVTHPVLALDCSPGTTPPRPGEEVHAQSFQARTACLAPSRSRRCNCCVLCHIVSILSALSNVVPLGYNVVTQRSAVLEPRRVRCQGVHSRPPRATLRRTTLPPRARRALSR